MRPGHEPALRSPMLTSLLLTLTIGAGVALVTVLGKVVETAIDPLFETSPVASVLIGGGAAGLIAFVFIFWQHETLERLVRSNARELDTAEITGRRYLIGGLSLVPEAVLKNVVALTGRLAAEDVGALCARPKSENKLGPWQQQLRLVHALRNAEGPRLDKYFLIDNGNGQAEAFRTLMLAAFADLTVTILPEGDKPLMLNRSVALPQDYESYDYVSRAFDAAFETIGKGTNMSRTQIEKATYIDSTPGMKVFSIAAAMQTVNRKALFLYVTTFSDPSRVASRPGGYTILGYDVRAQFAPRRV